MTSLLVTEVGGPITHPSLQQSNHNSTSNEKPIHVSFRNKKPTHVSTNPSLSANQNLLSLLNEPVNSSIYASLLESCKCPELGIQIHAHTLKTGFCGHEFIETKLLQMYGRCGSVEHSALVFEKMPLRNIYSWVGILTVCTDNGCFEEALLRFRELLIEDICLEFFVFPVILKACSGFSALELGRQVHGMVIKNQFISNMYVGNALLDMYGKCGSVNDAKKLLAKMPVRDCVSWNSVVTGCAANGLVFEALEVLDNMGSVGNLKPNLVSWSAVIGGFAKNGYDKEALELLYRMQTDGFKPNARTVASILPACARLQTLSIGKEIHGYVTRNEYMFNPYVVNGLVDVYRRCADMRSAMNIFSKFSMRNLVSINTMIVGYCETGEVSKARELFDQMVRVGTKKDIISWNSMVSGYVDNGMFDEALKMFRDSQFEEGIEADSFTLGSALTACADLAAMREGKEIHSYAIAKGLHSNPFVGGALVEMYCKCQDIAAAQMVFREVIEKDESTWNSLISGYARINQKAKVNELLHKMKIDGLEPNVYTWNGILAGYVENGENESVLQLFSDMKSSNLKPDIYTIGIVIPVCTRLGTIERGKQIHGHSIRWGYDIDVHIGASLVDMYAKCGSIKHAEIAYNRISRPNLVSRNAMLAGYAMHGQGEEGIDFFCKMMEEGIRPDAVTFLSVLSSCVHVGSIDLGTRYFDLMGHYNVEPTVKHYTCMVDLLSRAGRVIEAYELIKEMKVEPDSVTWGALLGGCIIHRNVELGEISAQRLIELEPNNTGNYVMLANLYASAERWDDLARTRRIINERGMQKSPGCSWIEDRDQMHVFLASDKSHTLTKEIYETLDNLTIQIRKEGCMV